MSTRREHAFGQFPPWGTASAQAAAIVGADDHLFPLRWHDTYDRFFLAPEDTAVATVADATAARHDRWNEAGVQMITAFLPSKTACLSDIHPLYLPARTTPAWRQVRFALRSDPGVIYCDELTRASAPAQRATLEPWRRTDTGLSAEGAAIVVRAILARLGIHETSIKTEEMEPESFSGSLADGWDTDVFERVDRRALDLEREPVTSEFERGTVWLCAEAAFRTRVALVVPNGDRHGNLSQVMWWISRLFRDSCVAWDEEDLADNFGPNIVVWILEEDFLSQPSGATGSGRQRGQDGQSA